ncbi:hypothetical protein [Burkholderia cenocepacia]|uniref:Uncharacterized protein n=1 Tax=Burkholderia cenocepacia TaxID=95486 RepID=A0ABD4UDE2_9BURK|nr:hypothetical protein [Burkholderia cenocepacia]MCW3696341.1 hypothetical protein [Burkholderia cenocepacia]MCW3704440.1 hypothetical protein [Burkholderia cenocepacia]MCW3712121.1 hypothetical protein [Burkholderia cenocepacia]MCW3720120.1 hypothetical protein [Burkholderia cenocepacia]MCW3727816.1 hypothetical protein [Burkholderia cenocepacia]
MDMIAHKKMVSLYTVFPTIKDKLNQNHLKGFRNKIQFDGAINGSLYQWVYDDVYKSTKEIFKQIIKELGLPSTGVKSHINMSARVHQKTDTSYIFIENKQHIKYIEGEFVSFNPETGWGEHYRFRINVLDWEMTFHHVADCREGSFHKVVKEMSQYDL